MGLSLFCLKKILSVIAYLFVKSIADSIDSDWPDMPTSCPHQYYPNTRAWVNITKSQQALLDIEANSTHLFYFENYKYIDSDRKVLFRLEACAGNVSMYIRRTRPCWPNPYTGERIHYQADDNDPVKVVEILSQSTQWFISVYSRVSSRYSLTVVPDGTAYPRRDSSWVDVKQVSRDTAQISWRPASAAGTGRVSQYLIYSTIWFPSQRVLNSVCGLQLNTDHPYSVVECESGTTCTANITALSNDRKYFFNVVVGGELLTAYAGVILRTHWDEARRIQLDEIASIAASVIASVIVILVTTYFILLRIYA